MEVLQCKCWVACTLYLQWSFLLLKSDSWIICESSCLFLFLHTQQMLHSFKYTAACRSEFEQWPEIKFHLKISQFRLSVWKRITLPSLFWESEREGSDSCSLSPVDCLTLQTDRWTMICHEDNALYYIPGCVLYSRFNKLLDLRYEREFFLQSGWQQDTHLQLKKKPTPYKLF